MNVAVYCSATPDLPEHWQAGARAVGQWIGRHEAQLIYGGVDAGLMSVVASATKDSGGRVVGVVPGRRRLDASALNDVKVPTSDLNDRKGVMQMLGDIFVVLPGGYGTLDEFTTSFSYLNFTQQKERPIIVYNADGIFTPVLEQFRLMVRHGLMHAEAMDIIKEVADVDALVVALDSTLVK